MKFKLSSTGQVYDSTYKYDIDMMEKLKTLGFTFRDHGNPRCVFIEGEPHVELNSLEELIQFAQTYGELIILPDGGIEIYNDYRD